MNKNNRTFVCPKCQMKYIMVNENVKDIDVAKELYRHMDKCSDKPKSRSSSEHYPETMEELLEALKRMNGPKK